MLNIIQQIYKKNQRFINYFFLSLFVKYSTFIFDIIVIHKLSKEHFGQYSLIFMVANLAFTFGFSWHSSVLLYIGAGEKAVKGKFNFTFHARNLITLFFVLFISITFKIGESFLDNYLGIQILGGILLYLYGKIVGDYVRQYFFAVQKQQTAQISVFIARIFQILMILILKVDLQQLILYMSLCEFLPLILIYKFNFNDIRGLRTDWITFKRVLNFSFWQFFGFAGLYVINFGDLAVIKHFLSVEDVATYNAAYRIFFGIAGTSYAITNYFAAYIVEAHKSKNFIRLKKFYKNDRRNIMGLIILGHLVLIATSRWTIPIVCGKQYVESVGIFSILMIVSIFEFFILFYTIFLNTIEKYKLLQTANLFRAFINIFLDIILIQYFGIYGTAIATVLAVIIFTVVLYFFSEPQIKNLYYKVE
ncbi:MAG: polysaccharide biosynthesis C-terminal domain-containing protein [Candidatus Marinimicrobia bacterium]|nr:polysaccharide biosynthesis C-terminal domain-containing protein [Candidatus Neomarinimicrobiota bacterium]